MSTIIAENVDDLIVIEDSSIRIHTKTLLNDLHYIFTTQ